MNMVIGLLNDIHGKYVDFDMNIYDLELLFTHTNFEIDIYTNNKIEKDILKPFFFYFP